MSLRATPPEDLLTEADRAEAARTWTVLPPAPREMAAAHVRAALKPGRYLRALRTALRTRFILGMGVMLVPLVVLAVGAKFKGQASF